MTTAHRNQGNYRAHRVRQRAAVAVREPEGEG